MIVEQTIQDKLLQENFVEFNGIIADNLIMEEDELP